MNQHLERLDGLAPFLRTPAQRLVESCDTKLHRSLLVVSGWRSVAEQLLNYQKGRTWNPATSEWEITDKAKVVTRSIPGHSAHNVISKTGQPASMALDVIPLLEDGTPEWDVGIDFWDRLYELSWKVGLDPLGDPIGGYLPMDRGHFEECAWQLKLDGLGLMQPTA